MKKMSSLLCFVAFASVSFAQSSSTVLRWQRIIGLITTPGVNNPVAGIAAGGLPWATTTGTASVNLSTGAAAFQVQGLVLIGGNASGTTGGIANVVGTLVCGGGTSSQATFDTSMAPLDALGNAQFSGTVSNLPTTCASPVFLIRTAAGSSGSWIATGAVFVMTTE